MSVTARGTAPTTRRYPQRSSYVLILGGILAFGSGFVAWWGYSYSQFTLEFFPGLTYQYSYPGASSSPGYAATGLGPVGGLYLAIQVMVLVGGVVAVFAAILRILAARRGIVSGSATTTTVLGLTSVALIVCATILAPALQPWAYNDSGNNLRCQGLGGATPCTAFWGSNSGATWGGALGWYLSLVGAALLLVGMILAWRESKR